MTLIILGISSIVMSWAVYYLFALVADSIYGKWRRFFFLTVIIYSVVLPFLLFEQWENAACTSFVLFLILAFGESILNRHVADKMRYDEEIIDKIEELEHLIKDAKKLKS